ncbi:MAG: flagellar basal body rod protein FlgF [Azonexus sp.]|jgi:flagellar basal-body rod protein FlgF|uniref:flagellar basal body rod protein FlgF n=1 Tax=Azonexus sp. TaxID=1872668 RepID=UPI00283967A6|nr:flagellar basal body rod protein FlgF [Azonexus sp.]MDR0777744.1 flagellar basal body rod protein FlgF [Azonexus sp.]
MDRLIYTAMTGAKHVFMQQAGTANNLANASTVGYKAQEHRFRAVPVLGEGMPTRAFTVDASVADVFDQGPLMFTGNDLDVAVRGKGWIALQMPDGSEAYTRAGGLQVDVNGLLQTKSGITVMGDGGAINIPPDNNIAIGFDGTVSVISSFGAQNNTNILGRIKLVNPPEEDLVRSGDGLFRLRSGQPAPVDENVTVAPGTLEGSNVNVTDAMVNLISLSRQFEMQIKLLQTADANAQRADQLLSLNA